MQNLIDFIVKYKYWFAFFLMEAFSLAMLFRFNSYQGSVFFTTANSMVGGLYSTVDGITSYVQLGAVNEQLEADNEALRAELGEMRQALLAKRIDTLQFAGFRNGRYRPVGGLVVNATTNRSKNLLTINKGTADGVRPEMGVICSRGVVGIVYLTSAHYSVVMPLINMSSRVSCQLKTHKSFGTVEWKFGDSEHAYMTGVPLHVKVSVNELVETSGFSDIFPSGIPVGRVESVETSEDGLSQSIKVRLSVDYTSVRNVSVITNYDHAEKRVLEYEADSLMNLD